MGKKVIVISASFRKNGNSDRLADEFARGAADAGNDVEKISLSGKKIAFCRGCFACQKTGQCIINDDAVEIEQKILVADVVVWATPIYYYEMAGQMKTLIDRLNPLYPKDYRFRDVYLLSVATDDGAYTPKRAEEGVKGWVECFEKASFKGSVFCGGVTDPGDILGREELAQAYNMGRIV